MMIVIFGDLFTFPDGSAATNRVYTYAKGFVENGINVHVICSMSYYSDNKNGVVDGIHYYIPFTPKQRSSSFFQRRWQNMIKYVRTFIYVRRLKKDNNIIAINNWSNLLITQLFGYILAKMCNAKLVVETSEHPLRDFQGGFFKRLQGNVKFLIETYISDGIICISHHLINFYRSKGIADKKLFLVPSTVDPNRFNRVSAKPFEHRYVGYFGSLTFDRDHIHILVQAFAIFCKKHPDVHIILGGFSSDTEKGKLVSLIEQLDLVQRVHILGYLKREDIANYVANADLLVMVRSNDPHTQVSYPSKLTEFLASSRPVISVNVGEIPLYMKDEEEVFLVAPGDVDALAGRMDYVFNNYDHALDVGKRGRKLTETIFNYQYQAKRMIDYILAR